MDRRCDRSYLDLLFPKQKMPKVTEETRLSEDLKMDDMSIKLLAAYIKQKYGEDSSLQPRFKTIGDIDAYIYYEYYCNKLKYL